MFSRQTREESTAISDEVAVKATVLPRSAEVPSIIAADLRIVGNLVCGGSVEIEGEVEGNVTCHQVTVRRTGVVRGDVVAERIQVDGEISGALKGREINLSETGKVQGELVYQSLSVKDGAFIDGSCKSVGSDEEALKILESHATALKDESEKAAEETPKSKKKKK